MWMRAGRFLMRAGRFLMRAGRFLRPARHAPAGVFARSTRRNCTDPRSACSLFARSTRRMRAIRPRGAPGRASADTRRVRERSPARSTGAYPQPPSLRPARTRTANPPPRLFSLLQCRGEGIRRDGGGVGVWLCRRKDRKSFDHPAMSVCRMLLCRRKDRKSPAGGQRLGQAQGVRCWEREPSIGSRRAHTPTQKALVGHAYPIDRTLNRRIKHPAGGGSPVSAASPPISTPSGCGCAARDGGVSGCGCVRPCQHRRPPRRGHRSLGTGDVVSTPAETGDWVSTPGSARDGGPSQHPRFGQRRGT